MCKKLATNFFGIDTTYGADNLGIDGLVFRTKSIPEEYEKELEELFKLKNSFEDKILLPVFFKVLQIIMLAVCLIFLCCSFEALVGGVSLKVQYSNAPELFWIVGMCFLVWFVLLVSPKMLLKREENKAELDAINAKSRKLYDDISKYLEIPDQHLDIYILGELYKIKDGKLHHVKSAYYDYITFNMSVYVKDDKLCLADNSTVYEIPLASFVKAKYVKNRVDFSAWTSNEKFDPDWYNKNLKLRSFYFRLEINDANGNYYLIVPDCDYDASAFINLIGIAVDK